MSVYKNGYKLKIARFLLNFEWIYTDVFLSLCVCVYMCVHVCAGWTNIIMSTSLRPHCSRVNGYKGPLNHDNA